MEKLRRKYKYSQVVASGPNVIGKFANTTGGTCGQDSSLKDLKNSNTNPKCESATSERLGNPLAAYPKDSYMKFRCSHDNAFSEASSGVECLKACEGQLSSSKSLRAAMLKIRFADTILKAQIENSKQSERVDPLKVKRRRGKDLKRSGERDFAADVKLTFSNAMKYNPLTNWVHELAGEFSRMFTLEWKSLEAKWSEEEKSDLVYKDQGLMEISKRKLPPKLPGHLRRLGLLCENKDDGETASEIQIFTKKARIDAHVKAAKEEVVLKLLRQKQAARLALEEMEKSVDVYDRVMEGLGLYLKNEFPEDGVDVEEGEIILNLEHFAGVVSEHWHHRVYLRVVVVLVSNESYQGSQEFLLIMLFENHHSLNMKRTPMKFIQISSMLVDENIALKNNLKLKVKLPQPKSQVENIIVKKKLKLKVKLPTSEISTSKTRLLCENKDDGETASEIQIFTSSCFQSNVIGKDSSLKDLKNSNTNPKCESATSKRLGNPLAAYPKDSYMKSRCSHDNAFSEASSDTIIKAQQKTLSTSERVDPLKVKQEERERFEKKQREEKAKIDAYVKAAKEEAALKLLRQRQAARLALVEMEKSAYVYDSFAIMKDLEMMGVAKCIGHDRVLEGLGLYLKNEFPEEDDDDVEEGEIICVECLKTCEGQLSPSKSLHAAMSKSRFADTILKAQQKTLSTGERVDPLKVKQEERERFEKKQIDAHVKAAKEEVALKLLRQKQAARLALEECLLVMLLENHHSLNMKRTPMKFIQISSMPVDENIALKKNLKLKVKLPQPKSQVENITVKKKLKLKVKLPRAKWSEEEKSDLVYKDQDLMEISKRKLPPKLHGHLRRLGLLCENKDDGEIASEIHIFTSSCLKSNVIGKFANTTGGTCGQDSSLKDLKNNNTNPKCESATSKRLRNSAAAYPKGSFGDTKSRCGHENAFSEASSGVECLKTCEGQLSPSKSLRAAMLKSRFADTILKAQQKTLSIGERVDPLKVKRGGGKDLKRSGEKRKQELMRTLKLLKRKFALKLLRLTETSHRLALEESVDVYDSFAIMKDLEMMGVAKCIGHDRVLEGLGLYLKNEFPEDGVDVEEGEIIC
ncbi:hypothetical protein Syun_028487 [Stephania yunnanensis]|uniref:Bromo domain-containing protein n=1 Tax=Stephania yunnanensis TaxID=152371 RepID=A0AAP0EHG6_9MAGN